MPTDVASTWTLESRPVLRDDLLVSVEPNGEVILRDPITKHVHSLSPIASAIAQLLSGTPTLAQIKAVLDERFGHAFSASEILAFVDDLDQRMLLLSSALSERLQAAQAEERATFRARLGLFDVRLDASAKSLADDAIEVREDLRYHCFSCGLCCSGRFRIELMDPDVEVLRRADLQTAFGWNFKDVVVERFSGGDDDLSEKRQYLKHHPDGLCVFLNPKDKLCELHRRLGYESKPTGCRIFPYYPVLTPEGGVIQFRPECASQYKRTDGSPLVAARKGQIWREIVENFTLLPAVPEEFVLKAGRRVTYDKYRALEAQWLETTRKEGWMALFARLPADLEIPALQSGRTLQRLVVAVVSHHETTAELRKNKVTGSFHEVLTAAEVEDDAFFTSLLFSMGVLRPQDAPKTVELAQSAGLLMGVLGGPLMDAEPVNRVIRDYVLDFICGKYAFKGLSIASGMALLQLNVFAARRMVAFVAGVHGVQLDAGLMNETLMAWHIQLINKDSVRTHLLVHLLDELERSLGLPIDEL